MNTKSHQRYFLAIVDDHTRMTWIHLMKHKLDVYDALKTFLNMAKLQFGREVKITRSDNYVQLLGNSASNILCRYT